MTVETVSRETLSRRAFLKTSLVSGSTIMLGSVIGTVTALAAQAGGPQEKMVRIVVVTIHSDCRSYSYDMIDNERTPSAETIVPDLHEAGVLRIDGDEEKQPAAVALSRATAGGPARAIGPSSQPRVLPERSPAGSLPPHLH
jgi:hypothetical protein